MKKCTIHDRIAKNCEKFHQYCSQRLKKRFKFGTITFLECHTQLIYQWFGRFDGKSERDETFNLHFNGDKTRYDTGKPEDRVFAPDWLVDKMFNNGQRKIFHVNNEQYCLTMVRIKNVGSNHKCQITNRFKRKVGDEWQVVM